MTTKELKAERRLEKVRARVVKAELKRIKREEEIQRYIESIFNIMSVILIIAFFIVAFIFDAFGGIHVPMPIYIIGLVYMTLYLYVIYRRIK